MEIKLEDSWKLALQHEFNQPYFVDLVQFVKSEYAKLPGKVFPEGKHIFRALDICSLSKVKVVILGQDPYPTKGHAHGLCFSVEKSVQPLPKSLQNIFKERTTDVGLAYPDHGDLTQWAEQGVLLLNTVLTVIEGKPDSHSGKGWERFTDAILKTVSDCTENVVFILWGSKAQAKISLIDQTKHYIIQSVHPSPLSAYRGFFGSKPFSRSNSYLKEKGKTPIEW